MFEHVLMGDQRSHVAGGMPLTEEYEMEVDSHDTLGRREAGFEGMISVASWRDREA